MNRQSKWGSFLETLLNVGFGFLVSLLVTLAVAHWGKLTMIDDPVLVTSIFTLVSVARSYFVRRASVYYSAWRARRVEKQTASCYNGVSKPPRRIR